MSPPNSQDPSVAPSPAVRKPKRTLAWWIVFGVVIFVVLIVGTSTSVFLIYMWAQSNGGHYYTEVYESLDREFLVVRRNVDQIDGPRDGDGLVLMRAKFHHASGEPQDIIWVFEDDRMTVATPHTHPDLYYLWNNSNYLDGSPAEPWPLPDYVKWRERMPKDVRIELDEMHRQKGTGLRKR